MNTFTIRHATRSDAETIVRYNDALAVDTEGVHLDHQRLRSGVNGLFDNPSFGFYIVADAGTMIAGQLMITYEWSDWRNGVIWWIQSAYVHPEYRSRGVFRALYEFILELAHKDGTVRGIRLYVEKGNEHARRVYEKMGMTLTHYDLYETDFVLKR